MPKRQEFHVPHPKDETFEALVQVLPTVKGMKVKGADPASGQIDASAGLSIWSWGERIRIGVTDAAGGSVVSISSGNKAQLVSWGKNKRNIAEIEAALHRRLDPAS